MLVDVTTSHVPDKGLRTILLWLESLPKSPSPHISSKTVFHRHPYLTSGIKPQRASELTVARRWLCVSISPRGRVRSTSLGHIEGVYIDRSELELKKVHLRHRMGYLGEPAVTVSALNAADNSIHDIEVCHFRYLCHQGRSERQTLRRM